MREEVKKNNDLLLDLPQKVLDGMSVVLKENGVVAGNITQEMLDATMEKVFERGRREAERVTEVTEVREEGREWMHEAYLWSDGFFHRLPEHFRFPDVTVRQCWKKVPPFALLTSIDIPKVEKKRWSDVSCMMKEVMKLLEEKHHLEKEEMRKMKTEELLGWCQKGIELIVRKTKKRTVRWNEWMVTTALRELREARNERDPGRKRKQKSPTPTSAQRNRNKRARVS